MDQDKALRDHLVKLIRGSQAFQPVGTLLQGLTAETAGKTIPHLPYTIWQLVDHMRFTVEDILEFVHNPKYKEPNWPDDYWPTTKAPASQQALDKSIQALHKSMEEMVQLVQDPAHDLYKPIPHGDGQTLLREAILVGEHTAYHLGQVVLMRRLLGDWES
ncbi:DinB family protein [Pontibacter mangrovi]|uniref:DinB family protein n=1 Tax=Pontibacter mangrovi TaxID=2589816 RepID=A0A501VWR0_9BACT|nr:DinB family protein [Pontibacter mangrovi]TPE42163.1 DinB family protein [Pontibacter mangrovi]